jgi:DNA-binding NarL/FixJ family response regulator
VGDRPWTTAETREGSIDAVMVSQVCLFREYVSQSLKSDPVVRVLEVCATLEHGLESVESLQPQMILLDAAFHKGIAAAAQLRQSAPEAQLVAVAIDETEENILDWAEAGIAGYVPNTASMAELPVLLRQIRWGEQSCSSRIAGSLLRRIGRLERDRGGDQRGRPPMPDLTPRERVILRHISAGLTNKDIARQLDISLGTAKSHVHNIFGKLNLRSRAQVAARMGSPLGIGE